MARTRQVARGSFARGINYRMKKRRRLVFKFFNFSPKSQPKEKTNFPIPRNVSFTTIFYELNYEFSIYTLIKKCLQNLPKDFKLITPSKTEYLINKIIIFYTSDIIKDLIEENPDLSSYQIKTNDCDSFISKFASILNGNSEMITKDEAKIAKKISKELEIEGFPSWMKSKKQRFSSYNFRNQINRKPPKFSIINISSSSFITFLKHQKSKQYYTIKTKNNTYQVPLFGIFCSPLITEQFNKKIQSASINNYINNINYSDNNNNDNSNDNSNNESEVDCFVYDIEDENREFEVMANFMSGDYYELNTKNMEISLKFTKDLGIDELHNSIQEIIENYNQRNKKIQDNIHIMDDIVFLRSQILRFRESNENQKCSDLVEDVFHKIIESVWCKDTEHVKEMINGILQISSIYYKIVDQISQLFILFHQAQNEREPLKILLPTLLDVLFCIPETPNNTTNKPIWNSLKTYRSIKAQLILHLKKHKLISSKEIVFMIGATRIPYTVMCTKFFFTEKDSIDQQQNSNYSYVSPEINLSPIHYFFSPEINEIFPNYLPENCIINDAQRFIEGEKGSLMNVIFNDDIEKFKEIESSTPNFQFNQTIFCPNHFNFYELSLIQYAAEVDSPKIFNYIFSKFDKSLPQTVKSDDDLIHYTSEFLRNVNSKVILSSMGKSRSIIQSLLPYIDDIIKEEEYMKEEIEGGYPPYYHFLDDSPTNDYIMKSRPFSEYMETAIVCHDTEMLEYFSTKSNQYLLCKSLCEAALYNNINAFSFLSKQIPFLHDRERLNTIGSILAKQGFVDFFIFLSKIFDINHLVGNFCEFQYHNNVGQNEISVFDCIAYSGSIRLFKYVLDNCEKAKSYSLSSLICQSSKYGKYNFIEYFIKTLKIKINPKEIEYIVSHLYMDRKPEIVKLIFENYPIPDQQIFYFIEVAATSNDIDFVTFLIDKQLKIDPRTTFKNAFNAAAKCGNLEICQYIASIHSDISNKTSKNDDNQNDQNEEDKSKNENNNDNDNDNTEYKFVDSDDDNNNNNDDDEIQVYNPLENLGKLDYSLTITMIVRYAFMYTEKSNFIMNKYFFPVSTAIEILRIYFSALQGKDFKVAVTRALQESLIFGIDEIIEFALSYKIKNKASIIVAARNGKLDVVKRLVEICSDEVINHQCQYGTAINAAIETNHPEIVDYLLSFPNINLKYQDYYLMSPLSTSAFYRRYDIFTKIIKTGKVSQEELNKAFLFYCSNTKKIKPFISPTSPNYFYLMISPKANREEIQSQEIRYAQMLSNCQISNDQLRTVFPNIVNENNHNGSNCFYRPIKSDLLKEIEEDQHFIDFFFNSEESKKLIDFNFFFSKETFLISACKFGRIELVKLLLQQPETNVNIYDDKGNTPLIHAVSQGHFSIVRLLCEEKEDKINLNQNNFFKRTAFTFAASTNRIDILKYIASRKEFNPNKSQACTAAAAAIIFGYKNIIEFLLSEKSDFNFDVNKEIEFNHFFGISDQSIKQSAIQMPVFNNNFNNPMQRNRVVENSTWSLLHVAVFREDLEAIKIISNHPSFNIIESNVDRTLYYAAKSNNISVFKSILEISKRDINFMYKGKEGRSLLCTAVIHKADKIIKYIINHPQFDPVKSNAKLAFFVSILSQPIEIIELCSTIKGIDFNSHCPKIPQELDNFSMGQFYNRNIEGSTPLYIAAASVDILNFFLNMPGNKIDVNCRNEDGSTPIFGAIQNQTAFDILLHQKDIDINAQDNNGKTVLMIMVIQKCLNLAPMILARDDVDISITDKEGKNALMYANPELSNIDIKSLSWKELCEIFAKSAFGNQDFY